MRANHTATTVSKLIVNVRVTNSVWISVTAWPLNSVALTLPNSLIVQSINSKAHANTIQIYLSLPTFVQPDNSLTTQFISMQNTQELSDSSPPANNTNHSPQPPGPVVYITPTPTLSPISSYGHYSPQSQAYSLQQHRTNLFPQLFSEIANQSREQLNDVTFYTPSASNSPLMLDTIYFLFDYIPSCWGRHELGVTATLPTPRFSTTPKTDEGGRTFGHMTLHSWHWTTRIFSMQCWRYHRCITPGSIRMQLWTLLLSIAWLTTKMRSGVLENLL